jgi:hypothetical protein
MSGNREQLNLDLGARLSRIPAECQVERRQERRTILRMVDYSPFPRACVDEQVRSGFAKNESVTGLCIAVESAQAMGSLLRVVVHGVDGKPTRDAIARVVWCHAQPDGHFHAGLELLREGARRMLMVRPDRSREEVAITA